MEMSRRSLTGCTWIAAAVVVVIVARASGAGEPEEVRAAQTVLELPGVRQGEVRFADDGRVIEIKVPRNVPLPDLGTRLAAMVVITETRRDDRTRTLRIRLEPGTVLQQMQWSDGGMALQFSAGALSEVYQLGPGDRVQIMVLGAEPSSWETVVGSDGTVMVPLLGKVQAAGATPEELEREITRRLAEGYLVDPQVGVTVTEFVSHWVLVTGFVRAPGRVPLRGRLDLRQALTFAGGFAPGSGENVVLQRLQDGQWTTTVLDRGAVMVGKDNPLLLNRDVVVVPQEEYCYVRGEVRRPGPIRWSPDLTLQRILAAAGGLTELAKEREVRLYRGSEMQVYNLLEIEDLRAEDPRIVPGDVILVKRRTL